MRISRNSRKSRTARTLLAATLTLGLGLGAGATAIAPASAAPAAFVATPNGMVGMTQEILISAPSLKGQPITIGFALGSAGTSQQTVVGSNGYGYMNWTPSLAGSWTISGLGNAIGIGTTTVNIAAMPTTTTLFTPTNATSNAVTLVSVIVSAEAGTYAPQGTINLASAFGNPVGTQQLTPIAGSANSYASFDWTPQVLGYFPLIATYTPSSNGTLASTSETANSLIVPNAGVVELRVPTSFRVGQPTVLSALVTPTTTVGSAAFQLNGGYLSGSIPLVNGVATTQWTPTQQGIQTITTQFSSTAAGGPSGAVSQAINVLGASPADVIAVSAPSGTWGPGRPISIAQGSNTTLTMSSASGSAVLLSESGPCAINGSVITGLSAGTCTVTAASVGSSAYSPASVTFVVTVTAPPRKRR
jgi:hypothetical protein